MTITFGTEINQSGEVAASLGKGVLCLDQIDTDIRLFDPLNILDDFEKAYPNEMKLFRLVGIHPADAQPVSNPYTGTVSSESFTNIGEHCLAVAYCASKIAAILQDAGHITADEAHWIVGRALVHDVTKPYEIMRRNAKNAGAKVEVYSVSAYEKLGPLLQEAGVSEQLARYLVNAGSETGHNSLINFVRVSAEGLCGLIEGSLPEKIVHLADDMTFTSLPKPGSRPITTFLTCWERMLASNFIEKYSFLWREGLIHDGQGHIEACPDLKTPKSGSAVVGNFARLQVYVANKICREVQMLVAPQDPLPAETFVKAAVNRCTAVP